MKIKKALDPTILKIEKFKTNFIINKNICF